MIKITQEDLVRYLYNETSEIKSAVIKSALQADWSLRQKFEDLLSSQHSLGEAKFSPRPQTINKIVEYASKRQRQLHSL